MRRFNNWLALKITSGVSTMWCAYVFALIAFTSLPSVLQQHSINATVQWVAQTFLQLVLLSVIMVGQRVQADMTVQLHDKIDRQHAHLTELRKLIHHGELSGDDGSTVSSGDPDNSGTGGHGPGSDKVD